MRNAT